MTSRDVTLIGGAVALAVLVAVGVILFLQDGQTDTDIESTGRTVEDEQETRATQRTKTPDVIPDVESGTQAPRGATTARNLGGASPSDAPASVDGIVLDPDGAPVPDASVTLCENLSDAPGATIQGTIAASVTTDDKGRFSITDIDTFLNYMLRADHNEYASAIVRKLELAPGATRSLTIRFELGQVVEGSVFSIRTQEERPDEDRPSAAEGSIRGVPLAGAEIIVIDKHLATTDPAHSIERTATTDSEGRFTLKNLKPGYKDIHARGPDHATRSRYSYLVKEGQNAEIAFRLPGGSNIVGRVVDNEENPVEGALISAKMMRGRNSVLPAVRSDEEGRFTYDGLMEGLYTLICHKKGYDAAGARHAARTGQTVMIKMVKNPTVKGRVVDAETGDPVTSFAVMMTRTPDLVFSNARYTERYAHEEGEFEYTGALKKGEGWVFATARGYAAGKYGPIDLSQGKDVDGIVIKLGRGVTATGTVVDSSGAPVAGASVELTAQAANMGGSGSFTDIFKGRIRTMSLKGRTDSSGVWKIAGLHEAQFTIRVTHSRYAETTVDDATPVGVEGEVTFPKVTLMSGGKLTGIVRDKDGEPEAGTTVQIIPKGGFLAVGMTTRTGSDGRYSFDRIPPGIYIVRLAQRGGSVEFNPFAALGKQPPEVIIEEGGSETLDLD